jgi:hypothetical protein
MVTKVDGVLCFTSVGFLNMFFKPYCIFERYGLVVQVIILFFCLAFSAFNYHLRIIIV